MEKEMLSSSPGYPGHVEMVGSCIREVQTGRQETLLDREGGPTLEQASWRAAPCPEPFTGVWTTP